MPLPYRLPRTLPLRAAPASPDAPGFHATLGVPDLLQRVLTRRVAA